MDWNQRYPGDTPPDLSAVSTYIGSPLWAQLCTHLEDNYGVHPLVEHSICSGAAGWNLKYRKSSRALCTLYPAQGFFTCMVSVGRKEALEAELLLPGCTDYVQQLYWNTKLYNGGRWLMIQTTTPEILRDVKALIALRVRPRGSR